MRRRAALFSLILMLAGCSPAGNGITSQAPSVPRSTANPNTTPTSQAGSGVVAILRIRAGTSSNSLVSVDAVTGKFLARLPVGAPDRTWRAIYVTQEQAGTTV